MTEKEMFIKAIKRAVDGIQNPEDFVIFEEDGTITLIGSSEQIMNFQFDDDGNLEWYD